MHMVIRTIVYADNKKYALIKARQNFEQLVESHVFDYYVTFDEAGSSVSGRGRWGNLPAVAEIKSKAGQKLLNEGWKFTEDAFLEHMKEIRKALKSKTDREILKEAHSDARWRMCSAGEYEGSDTWLYDDDGCGIRDKDHLNKALGKWNEEKKKVWIVPADVHH